MIKAYEMSKGYWKNVPTERLIKENELNNMSGCIDSLLSQTQENKNMKPLNCKCCGAPINRETMTCEYCGVQYGKGSR